MKTALKLGAALLAIAAAGAIAGCTKKTDKAEATKAAAESTKPVLGTFGLEPDQGDPAVKPGDDFARYANGKWLDTFEIPADLAGYVSFTKLRLDAEADVKAIIEDLAAKPQTPGSVEQKVGTFYKNWLDTAKVDADGTAPLAAELAKINAIADSKGLMAAFGDIHMMGPVGFFIDADPADTTKYAVFVGQSGLGMPDRDYYLKTDERFVQYRAAYKSYIAKVLGLAGIADAAKKADAILAFETAIAKTHWSQEESRNIQKIYNPMTVEQMAKAAPAIDWPAVMEKLGASSVKSFVLMQPSAVAKSADLFAKADLAFLKDYLAFHFIDANAAYLPTAFDQANFDFYGKTLRGVKEQRERWKRGVGQIDAGLGDAVGQVYVQRHFPPANKAKMDALVQNLLAALKERLEKNEWMDDATREQALLKLSTFEPRIGYTKKWTDYSSLAIKDGALLENGLALTEFQWKDQLSRINGPVDRDRWDYPPQTVNASYNPLMNNITFPAGILQPPFFDPNADPAVNYGAIGAVIGHEIGHGFDDQGSEFDEKGRIRNWWTPASKAAFKERTDRLGAQYDGYEPLPGARISGELTMGENIGDLGGLQMAYAAYHRYLDETSGGKAPVIDGLTGDQRLFLAWAQVWRGKYREDEARGRLETDPHSPPYYRINGVVRNIDAWYEAFGVQEGDKMYLPPEERVRIW
jgi:endothelin-converting enzyme/putative endopeptidase